MSHVLRTERLVLRPVATHDHARLLAHWTAPDVRRFLFDGAVLSPEEITGAIGDSARDFAAGGYGLWLIWKPGGTEMAGTAGLRPLEDLGLEVFYSLAPGAWGQGYATEAARAILEFGFAELGVRRIWATCRPENVGSCRVLEKIGMVREGHLREHVLIRGEWRDSLLYASLTPRR